MAIDDYCPDKWIWKIYELGAAHLYKPRSNCQKNLYNTHHHREVVIPISVSSVLYDKTRILALCVIRPNRRRGTWPTVHLLTPSEYAARLSSSAQPETLSAVARCDQTPSSSQNDPDAFSSPLLTESAVSPSITATDSTDPDVLPTNSDKPPLSTPRQSFTFTPSSCLSDCARRAFTRAALRPEM